MKSGVNVDSVTTRIFKYYPNGMRFYEQDIFDNEPNGKYRSWYPSGKKFAVGNYINGELFGKWSWYGDDGFLDSVRTYNHIEDAIQAYWLCSNSDKYGEVYNIGGDYTCKVGDTLDMLLSMSTLLDLKPLLD